MSGAEFEVVRVPVAVVARMNLPSGDHFTCAAPCGGSIQESTFRVAGSSTPSRLDGSSPAGTAVLRRPGATSTHDHGVFS